MTRSRLTSFCALLALFLAGCASVSVTPPPPVELIPAHYKHANADSAPTVQREWWKVYKDPTLNNLVETTLRDNPYTQVAHLRLIAAQAQTRRAGADNQPQVNAGLGFGNSRTSSNTPLGEVLQHNSISGNKYTAGFDAVWQMDLWNRVGYAVEASKAGEDAERAFARMVEQTLSWEVAVTYWQYRQAESDLALLKLQLQHRITAEDVLNKRFSAGLISELDLARARLERRNAEAELDGASTRMQQAQHELATLTVKPVAEFTLPTESTYQPPAVPSINPGLPASILQRRPDLAQSAQNIRSLLAQKEIANTALYPSISLTGNFGFASSELRNLVQADSRQFSLGPIAISLPILDGGRIRASQTIANARYQEAVNVHKVQLLIALREVDDVLAELASYHSQAEHLQSARSAAQQVARMVHSRYDLGAINYVDVAQAERELAVAELKLKRNHFKGLLASTQLVYVLGGGWTDDTAVATTAQPTAAPTHL